MKLGEKIMAYMPYKTLAFSPENKMGGRANIELCGRYFDKDGNFIHDMYKLALIPLEELNEDNADFLSGDTYLLVCEEGLTSYSTMNQIPYLDVQKLLKRGYDVFNLIEEGYALNINKILNKIK